MNEARAALVREKVARLRQGLAELGLESFFIGRRVPRRPQWAFC